MRKLSAIVYDCLGFIKEKNYKMDPSDIKLVTEPDEFECRINPFLLKRELLEHKPTTGYQERILKVYQKAKDEGKLYAFTCMTIDPSIKYGKLVYKKGMTPAVGFSIKKWKKLLKKYNPSRNSRMMSETEYACRELFRIQRLVESGYEIEKAWEIVCDKSVKDTFGLFWIWEEPKSAWRIWGDKPEDFLTLVETLGKTGSSEVSGFCDLSNTLKLCKPDGNDDGICVMNLGAPYRPNCVEELKMKYEQLDYYTGFVSPCAVGMLAMDPK